MGRTTGDWRNRQREECLKNRETSSGRNDLRFKETNSGRNDLRFKETNSGRNDRRIEKQAVGG
jgi:hypothetical protein